MDDWTKDTPPRPGWYVASYEQCDTTQRYWDGNTWSAPVTLGAPLVNLDRARARRGKRQRSIAWKEMTT